MTMTQSTAGWFQASSAMLPTACITLHMAIIGLSLVSYGVVGMVSRTETATGPGELRSICPVLTLTSDQGSTLFAAQNHLAYSCGLRLVWFPDLNHIEANVDTGVLQAAGLAHLAEKALFLSRLNYGPKREVGHWHGQMQLAHKAGVFLTLHTPAHEPTTTTL